MKAIDDSSPCSATMAWGDVVTKAIISRKEAKEQGFTKYNGKVCEKHPELKGARRTYSSNCISCNIEYAAAQKSKKRLNPKYRSDELTRAAERKSERRRSDPKYKSKELAREIAYKIKRRNENPLFNLICRVRGRLLNIIRKKGFTKRSKTSSVLGCTWQQLKEHIEFQFVDGMNWGNRHLWHIDHKIPLATAKTEEDIYKLCHYINLQPLWAEDNLHKGSKFDQNDKLQFLDDRIPD